MDSVLKFPEVIPQTAGGGEVLSCDLDAKCVHLHCEGVVDAFGPSLMTNPEGQDFLGHYCGYSLMARLQLPEES